MQEFLRPNQQHPRADSSNSSQPTVLTYSIDAADQITSVSAEWHAFASENGAPGLVSHNVIGRNIFQFITAEEVKHLYTLVFEQVRRHGRSLSLRFRCDAPEVRRHMELNISLLRGDALRFTTRLLSAESREAIPMFDSYSSNSNRILVLCSWCKKVQSSAQDWSSIEEASNLFNLFTGEPPRLSHAICPACASEVYEVIGYPVE